MSIAKDAATLIAQTKDMREMRYRRPFVRSHAVRHEEAAAVELIIEEATKFVTELPSLEEKRQICLGHHFQSNQYFTSELLLRSKAELYHKAAIAVLCSEIEATFAHQK